MEKGPLFLSSVTEKGKSFLSPLIGKQVDLSFNILTVFWPAFGCSQLLCARSTQKLVEKNNTYTKNVIGPIGKKICHKNTSSTIWKGTFKFASQISPLLYYYSSLHNLTQTKHFGAFVKSHFGAFVWVLRPSPHYFSIAEKHHTHFFCIKTHVQDWSLKFVALAVKNMSKWGKQPFSSFLSKSWKNKKIYRRR